jgi:hypothetical protein
MCKFYHGLHHKYNHDAYKNYNYLQKLQLLLYQKIHPLFHMNPSCDRIIIKKIVNYVQIMCKQSNHQIQMLTQPILKYSLHKSQG